MILARLLPFVISMIAGATGAIGVLGLNGLLTAHITCNLVLLAGPIVAGLPVAVSYIPSVRDFMLILFLVGVIARTIEQRGGSSLPPLQLLQLLALIAFFVISVTDGPWRNPDAGLAVTAGISGVAAMAVQNALAQVSLKNTATTAVMTTNVTQLMSDLSAVLIGGEAADVVKAKSCALQTLPVAIGFVIGCTLATAGEAAVGLSSLMLRTGLALLAFVVGIGHGTDIRYVRR